MTIQSSSPRTSFVSFAGLVPRLAARVSDPPPGNTVIWRGLARLTDILLGFDLKNRGYG